MAYNNPFGSMLLFFLCVSRKEQIAEQREYKKKKAQKKVQRMKELEQEREEQKSKWQQFNNKAYSKTKKGQVWFFLSSSSSHIWLCSLENSWLIEFKYTQNTFDVCLW